MSRRGGWRRAILAVVVVVALCGLGWLVARTVTSVMTHSAPVARQVGRPLPVRVAPVSRETISEVVGGATLAQAHLSTTINVAVSEARVQTVAVDLGHLVRPGQLLVSFDAQWFREALDRAGLDVQRATAELRRLQAEQPTRLAELRAAVAAARERVVAREAAASTAKTMVARLRVLWERGVAPLAQLEEAQVRASDAEAALTATQVELEKAEHDLANEPLASAAALAAVRASLASAEQLVAQAGRNMDNTRVVSPGAGVIAQRTVAPGEWVREGKAIFLLDLLDRVDAVAEVQQEKADAVRLGQEAEVVFDAFPTVPRRAAITKIDPVVDPQKRTFKVFVTLPNPRLEIRPGMAAFTRIRHTREATLVPRLAVINPTGSAATAATVFVVEDSRAIVRKVKIGRSVGPGRLEVLDGLRAGDLVVVHGQLDLNPGDRVEATVVESAARTGDGRR